MPDRRRRGRCRDLVSYARPQRGHLNVRGDYTFTLPDLGEARHDPTLGHVLKNRSAGRRRSTSSMPR